MLEVSVDEVGVLWEEGFAVQGPLDLAGLHLHVLKGN